MENHQTSGQMETVFQPILGGRGYIILNTFNDFLWLCSCTRSIAMPAAWPILAPLSRVPDVHSGCGQVKIHQGHHMGTPMLIGVQILHFMQTSYTNIRFLIVSLQTGEEVIFSTKTKKTHAV